MIRVFPRSFPSNPEAIVSLQLIESRVRDLLDWVAKEGASRRGQQGIKRPSLGHHKTQGKISHQERLRGRLEVLLKTGQYHLNLLYWELPTFAFCWSIFLGKNLVNLVGWAISYLKVPNYEPVCLFEFWGRAFNWPSFIEIGEIACSTPAWGTHGLTLKPAGIGTRDYSKFSVDEYNYNDLSQVDGNGFFSNCLNYIDELLSSF